MSAATKSIPWFVANALSQGGVHETPLGSNKTIYGRAFGWNGVAWCVEFGYEMYQAAGVVWPVKTASCVVLYDACEKAGLTYVSTKAHVGDGIVRTWQKLSRHAPGFNPSLTHFQMVVKTKRLGRTVRHPGGTKYLGLWGGNQGAGYVGPAIEWVPAGDATILGGLAFHRLFDAPASTPPVHDKTVDQAKGLPAAKSHPTALASQSVKEAAALTKRLNRRRNPVAADGSRRRLRRLRAAINRALHRK